MSSVILQLIFLFFLILLNGFFAMSEIAIVSGRRTRFQQLADEGDPRARTLLALTANPSRFLSTLQTGITLVGILTGAFGGTTVAEELGGVLQGVPFLGASGRPVAVVIVVLATTFLSILVGELIPKQIALQYAESVALSVAKSVRLLAAILSPLARVLAAASGLVLRLFGVKEMRQQPVSEEEIKVMIDEGIEHGMFVEAERDMIEGVFTLGDKRVVELMTPRGDVVWLDMEDTREAMNARIRDSGHSRFPVCRGDLDTLVGIVRAKDILNCMLAEQSFDLSLYAQPPLYVPENALVLKALEAFKKGKQHVALAVDEYGVVQGLITIYDIMEAIVGDMPSAEDEADGPMAVKRADGSWLLDGLLPLDRFKEIFGFEELPEEGSYQTLGGFMMLQLGRIPSPADAVTWKGVRLEVVDMEKNRVGKVLALAEAAPARSSPAPGPDPHGPRPAAGGRGTRMP
jgi:putative hemolysin